VSPFVGSVPSLANGGTVHIRLAHSPDADDAFMFYALAKNKISSRGHTFEHVLSDIETLNQEAFLEKFEVTALSLHAFAHVSDKYWLLPNGASIGKGYGPIVVAREPMPLSRLSEIVVAIPGQYTTAALMMGLVLGEKFQSKVIPFDQIIPAVLRGEVEAGVIIHEGQLTYSDTKLAKILDLGQWWEKKTGLPLPLGVDAVRKNVGLDTAREIAIILEESIRYAIEHEDEALDYALDFSRGTNRETARKFVRMYVNERTLRYSEEDKKAVQMVLSEGYKAGLLPFLPQVSFDLVDVGSNRLSNSDVG